MRLAWESRLGEQNGSKISQKAKKNSNYAFQTLYRMQSLNLNCAIQGELPKNSLAYKLGEFTGRVSERAGTLLEQ